MIGVDWGTTRLRAYRIGRDGGVLARTETEQGILAIPAGGFAEALHALIDPWLRDGESSVLLAGMVGSRQGWLEAPYLPCPAGLADLAAALVAIPFDGARVKLVPGLIGADADNVPEVMRGEETQIAGISSRIGDEALVCLPGTHSKWARVRDGRIVGFQTHLTGELFAAVRGHTILGRTMRDAPHDATAFAAGLARAAQAGGLGHHLFGVRALALAGVLAEDAGASYLSGLLIGHEIGAALAHPPPGAIHLIGTETLADRYATAIAAAGQRTIRHAEDTAAAGLHAIAARADWS